MNALKHYLAEFEGRSAAGSIIIPADKTIRLPDQPCRLAMLSNWNVQDVSAFTAKTTAGLESIIEDDLQEIYYGFGGRIIAQLFAGRNTELFPVGNLDQICVRCRPGNTTTVWYAWFW